MVESLWKTIWQVLNRLNIELTCVPVISLQGNPRRNENICSHKTFTLMFIAAVFTIPKKWRQPKCLSAEGWIKKYGTVGFTQPEKGTKY